MATLETQYRNYISNPKNPIITYDEWLRQLSATIIEHNKTRLTVTINDRNKTELRDENGNLFSSQG